MLNIIQYIIRNMKKVILIYVFMMTGMISANSQPVNNGYIIDKSVSSLGLSVVGLERFTPTEDDIRLAEMIIRHNRDIVMKSPNYYSRGKGIWGRYKKYFKQYVGFVNGKGEKIILINYVGDKKLVRKRDASEPIVVLDGGNDFWRAVINIDKEILIDVEINGQA